MMKLSLNSVMLAALLLFSTQSFAKFTQIGISSYYGPGFHGKKTSSGERFNMYGFTMAHRTIKNGKHVKVTNLKNGRSIIVKKNDSGPYVRGRVADLSLGARNALKMGGLALVKLEVLD